MAHCWWSWKDQPSRFYWAAARDTVLVRRRGFYQCQQQLHFRYCWGCLYCLRNAWWKHPTKRPSTSKTTRMTRIWLDFFHEMIASGPEIKTIQVSAWEKQLTRRSLVLKTDSLGVLIESIGDKWSLGPKKLALTEAVMRLTSSVRWLTYATMYFRRYSWCCIIDSSHAHSPLT